MLRLQQNTSRLVEARLKINLKMKPMNKINHCQLYTTEQKCS